MKALFAGLGSIGQRHLRNLMAEMKNDVQIIVYRETNHDFVIADGKATEVESLADYYGFSQVSSLDKGLEQDPDIVFITNPSSKHLDIAIPAAATGAHLFIEKPLSHSSDGVSDLQKLVAQKGQAVMMGFQARFHPCYQTVRKIITENVFGKVISAHFEWGTYLPRHHLYEDYANSYAARDELGGGVTLGLIHELDIIQSYWGQPESLVAVGGKLSHLNMDTDDTVSVLMKYTGEKITGPVTLFLSYAQTKEHRYSRIQFENATIFCDMQDKWVRVYDNNGNETETYNYPELLHNDLFVDEIKELLHAINNSRQPLVNLHDGVESLKLALRIKEKFNE